MQVAALACSGGQGDGFAGLRDADLGVRGELLGIAVAVGDDQSPGRPLVNASWCGTAIRRRRSGEPGGPVRVHHGLAIRHLPLLQPVGGSNAGRCWKPPWAASMMWR